MPILKNIVVKVSQGVFEYLLLLPIFLILGNFIIYDEQLWYWLLSLFVLFIIGVVYRSIFSNQKWWLFSAFSLIIGISSSFIFDGWLLITIALAVIHTFIVYRGMMYASVAWNDLLSLSILWLGGMAVYFVSYFIFRFADSLNPYLDTITLLGTIFIIMTMFLSNSDHLKKTTLSKEEKPFISKHIKNQNRIFLSITIVIILLITNGQMIRDALWNGFRAVVGAVLGWMSRPVSEEMIEAPPETGPMESEFPFDDDMGPSAIAKFLEMIAVYVVYFLLVIVAVFLLLLLIKKTRMWMISRFRQLIQFLKGIVSQVAERGESTQYIEEKENVFDWQEWKEEQQSKAKGFIKNIFTRKPSWNSLSNQQKVRYVFKNFLLQEIDHAKFKDNATPREILEQLKLSTQVEARQIEQLRMAYEQTRYGEQDIDEQIVNEIRALIHKK